MVCSANMVFRFRQRMLQNDQLKCQAIFASSQASQASATNQEWCEENVSASIIQALEQIGFVGYARAPESRLVCQQLFNLASIDLSVPLLQYS